MASRAQILGVVLAGGTSRRFGGGDKGLADLGGQPVLSHVVERFGPQVARLILNVNGDASRFASFDLPKIADAENPGLGPLSGILAALDWQSVHAPDCIAIATVSADVPFLPADLIARLNERRGDGIAIAISGGRRHPTIALWPRSARDVVAKALARRDLSVNALTERLNAVAVEFPMRNIGGSEIDPFFNINTRDDLATASALLREPEEDKNDG
jgi:molybdopterin-guanine dinucleotide biosynthesis protein A